MSSSHLLIASLWIVLAFQFGCAGNGAVTAGNPPGLPAKLPAKLPARVQINAEPAMPVKPPSEALLFAWFATARAWVEEETGASLSNVKLKLILRNEMHAIGDATLSQLFVDKPVSFKLLRKLKRRNRGRSQASVVAVFDPVLNNILLPREALLPFSRTVGSSDTVLEDAYIALFVHELVHAADYLKYPDNIIFSQKNLGNLAVRAVVEGHAQYLTRKLCQKKGCDQGYRTLRDDVVSAPGAGGPAASEAVQAGEALSNFCYLHGERFFNSLEPHPGAIEKALAHPPTDPVMIRYPGVYLKGIRAKKQIRLSTAFHSVAVPWNADRSLLLHNTNFVPFEGYNPRRQLAQNNYEVLHEGVQGVDTTNVNIFWKSSSAAANSFYRRLLKPSRKRLSGDGNYQVHLLNKSQHKLADVSGNSDSGRASGRLGAMQFDHQPTKAGLISNRQQRAQQIVVGTSGPFVVSVARISTVASEQGLRAYTANLLQALQQVN